MAKKHFDEFFYNQKNTYFMAVETCKKLLELLEKGEIEEERVNNFKIAFEPLANTYHILSKVKQLLDRPVKKEKYKTYKRQTKKFNTIETEKYNLENIQKQNEETVQKLKDILEKEN